MVRLAAFEAMLAAVRAEYAQTAQKMGELKAQGREKSATYRQLMARKLQLAQMIEMYREYGLIEG